MSTPRNTPVQDRAVKRLARIKAAAVMLYNDPEVGRDRLTTADVALLADCAIGTVYRYFTDRVALLDAIAPDRDQSPVVIRKSGDQCALRTFNGIPCAVHFGCDDFPDGTVTKISDGDVVPS